MGGVGGLEIVQGTYVEREGFMGGVREGLERMKD